MTQPKECFKCNKVKPLGDFYKHRGMSDGHLNKCKECTKNEANKHRSENIERVREYDRQRGKTPKRIKKTIAITKAWRESDRRRSVAHSLVARAIQKGTLCPKPCVRCNSEESVAHHEDYDRPLEVVWLCQPCHRKRHQEIDKQKGEVNDF